MGLDIVEELKSPDGVQLYVYPAVPLFGVAVITVELPLQIIGLVALALAVSWSTVTVTFAVALQLLASVMVTV